MSNALSHDESPSRRDWSRRGRDAAIVLWPSFLAASVETMVFFSKFDPIAIVQGSSWADLITTHDSGYALGFFFFWAFTTTGSTLTLYLARTESSR